jgi:hypothetical protein
MSNPLMRHEAIAANLLFHFHNQLRGGPCRAWGLMRKSGCKSIGRTPSTCRT